MENTFGGPYISAAFFCERVLHEKDGVASYIRVIERCTITGAADSIPVTLINTNLVINLTAGIYSGRAKIVITPLSPSGKQLPSLAIPVNFEGDDVRGIEIKIPVALPVEEQGVYWFEISVLISDEKPVVLTRIPLRVVYQQIAHQHSAPNVNQ